MVKILKSDNLMKISRNEIEKLKNQKIEIKKEQLN